MKMISCIQLLGNPQSCQAHTSLALLPPHQIADLPQLDGPVRGAGGQQPPIRAERHGQDIARVPGEGADGKGLRGRAAHLLIALLG